MAVWKTNFTSDKRLKLRIVHPTPARNGTSSDSSPDNQQTTSPEPLHGGVYIGKNIANMCYLNCIANTKTPTPI